MYEIRITRIRVSHILQWRMNNFAVQTTNCIKYSEAKSYISDIIPLQTHIEHIKLPSKNDSTIQMHLLHWAAEHLCIIQMS